jgi:hypothetical protein
MLTDSLGWLATGVFAGSYLCARPESVRRVQMGGAVLWVAYGLFIQALPVVAANVLVLSAASWAARREARRTS